MFQHVESNHRKFSTWKNIEWITIKLNENSKNLNEDRNEISKFPNKTRNEKYILRLRFHLENILFNNGIKRNLHSTHVIRFYLSTSMHIFTINIGFIFSI